MRISFIAFVLCASPCLGAAFSIGNSLSNDGYVDRVMPGSGKHISWAQTLPYIYANPDSGLSWDSTRWDVALAAPNEWDALIVQPFRGSDLQGNVDAITHWMDMQPDATVVLYAGWAKRPNVVADYEAAEAGDGLTYSDACFSALRGLLAYERPGRDIRIAPTHAAWYNVATDDDGPYSVFDLYRGDDIHASYLPGSYLAHNTLRYTLGLDWHNPVHPSFGELTNSEREYLHGVIAGVSVPGPVSALAIVGIMAWRWQWKPKRER